MKNDIYFIDRTPFTTPYHPTDGREITVSVGCRGRNINENQCTAFADGGGIRRMTEDEVAETVARYNAVEGWVQGDVEDDGTPILTHLQ